MHRSSVWRSKWVKVAVCALIATIIVGVTLYGLDRLIGTINIMGFVSIRSNVEMNPSTLYLSLNINTTMGSVIFKNIAKLYVRNSTRIIVKPSGLEESNPGNMSIQLSGTLFLESSNRNYTINMPCLYSNTNCVRILILIPGYDEPLEIDSGVYNVSIKLNWIVEGAGNMSFRLSISILEVKT